MARKQKEKKTCELCDKKTKKLIHIRVSKDLYIYICKECDKAERELWWNKRQPKHQPKRQLDCQGIENKSKVGKISLPEIIPSFLDMDDWLGKW
jgi:ribosome-binding protein aMBF1 (putative translation factor)